MILHTIASPPGEVRGRVGGRLAVMTGVLCALVVSAGTATASAAVTGPGVEGAPSGAVLRAPSTVIYHGKKLPASSIDGLAVACVRDLVALRCFDSLEQLQARTLVELSSASGPPECLGRPPDYVFTCDPVAIAQDEDAALDATLRESLPVADQAADPVTRTSASFDSERLVVENQANAVTGNNRSASARCGNVAVLYEHGSFNNGRSGWTHTFWERRRWTDVGSAHNDETSSFEMGNHSGHLSEHTVGRGYWYPGNTEYCHKEARMISRWNDRITSVWRN